MACGKVERDRETGTNSTTMVERLPPSFSREPVAVWKGMIVAVAPVVLEQEEQEEQDRWMMMAASSMKISWIYSCEGTRILKLYLSRGSRLHVWLGREKEDEMHMQAGRHYKCASW